MKYIKRVLPIILSALIITAAAFPAFAQSEPTSKEEVIYVNLDGSGTVKDIYAVNIFGKGDVTDYGDYSAVEILNTSDKISQNGDNITFSATADRVYYKGKLKSTAIPWIISIGYYLDGKEYSAKEIAGKSGNIQIEFKVEKNNEYNGNFYKKFALQATFTLDTEKCSNIVANDATIANVGSKKQISYTILPNEGIDTVISADVTDFEMDSVSINGIPLSMNIEIDDKELTDKIDELTSAIEELDSGTGKLNDGAKELKTKTENDLITGVNDLVTGAAELNDGAENLKSGGKALNDGAKELNSGAKNLCDGITALDGGSKAIRDGLNELSEKSADLISGSNEIQSALISIQTGLSSISASAEQIDSLVSGSSQIKSGIDKLTSSVADLQNNVSFAVYKSLMKQNGLDIDELQKANENTVAALNAQIDELGKQISYLEQNGGDETQIAQLKASLEQLKSTVILISGNNAAINGMNTYLTQLHSSIGELLLGLENLKDSYEEFDTGIRALAAEVKSLMVKMTELKSGIDTLVFEYGRLSCGIGEYTDGVAKVAAGYSVLCDGIGDLVAGSSQLKSGTAQLYDKTGELVSGTVEFYNGTSELVSGTNTLNDGTNELTNGISELYDGTKELKSGTSELYGKTDGMDGQISDKIDEAIEDMTGSGEKMTSFTSEKNTNIKSVQFVIKTESVEIAKAETAAAKPASKLTFWQKLLRLFGINI